MHTFRGMIDLELITIALLPLFSFIKRGKYIQLALIALTLLLQIFIHNAFSFYIFGFSFSFYRYWIAFLLLLISIFTYLFSFAYIKENSREFYLFYSIFILFMYYMLLSQSLIQFAAFWELMGIASFLLIGFYRNDESVFGSRKAIIFTYIGDIALLLFVSQMYGKGIIFFNQLSSLSLFYQVLILIAALSKSSQFPLLWLQDAMVAPTPVSALLHSATMVISGVFLLLIIRSMLTSIYPFLFLISIFTIVLTLILALLESNIKKFLAYFTVSSISTMIIGAFVNPFIAFVYIFIHAFYKVAAFISAGEDKLKYNEEDIYRLMSKKLPKLGAINYVLFSLMLGNIVLTSAFFAHLQIFHNLIISVLLLFLFAVVGLKPMIRVNKISKTNYSLLSIESFVLLVLSFSLVYFVLASINVYAIVASVLGLLIAWLLWVKRKEILKVSIKAYSFISNYAFKLSTIVFSFFYNFYKPINSYSMLPEKANQYLILIDERKMVALAIIGLSIAILFAL